MSVNPGGGGGTTIFSEIEMYFDKGDTISNVPLTIWAKIKNAFFPVENCHAQHVFLTNFKHQNEKFLGASGAFTKLYTILDFLTLFSARFARI